MSGMRSTVFVTQFEGESHGHELGVAVPLHVGGTAGRRCMSTACCTARWHSRCDGGGRLVVPSRP